MTTPSDRGGDTARQPELSFNVHRGVFNPGGVHSSNSGVGVHWSANKTTAEQMAAYASVASSFPPHPKDSSTVHHASVPVSSLEFDTNTLKKNGVLSVGDMAKNSEQEIPVRKGATVKVTGRTKVTNRNGAWKTRERTYNPPREVKA